MLSKQYSIDINLRIKELNCKPGFYISYHLKPTVLNLYIFLAPFLNENLQVLYELVCGLSNIVK
jgi:hypothetical protein